MQAKSTCFYQCLVVDELFASLYLRRHIKLQIQPVICQMDQHFLGRVLCYELTCGRVVIGGPLPWWVRWRGDTSELPSSSSAPGGTCPSLSGHTHLVNSQRQKAPISTSTHVAIFPLRLLSWAARLLSPTSFHPSSSRGISTPASRGKNSHFPWSPSRGGRPPWRSFPLKRPHLQIIYIYKNGCWYICLLVLNSSWL